MLLSSTKVGPYRLKFGPTAQNLWQNRPKSVTRSKIRLGPKIFDRPKIVARPKNLSQPPLFLVARTPMPRNCLPGVVASDTLVFLH